MPNMLGGNSSHPAHDSRSKLGPHEDISNWTHYRVEADGHVSAEIPDKLLDYLATRPRKPWASPVITERT